MENFCSYISDKLNNCLIWPVVVKNNVEHTDLMTLTSTKTNYYKDNPNKNYDNEKNKYKDNN